MFQNLVCKSGFRLVPGHIPWGHIETLPGIADTDECGNRCQDSDSCKSYEHSHAEMTCILNRVARPIQNVYRDYVFCAKSVPVEKLKRTREFTLCFRHMTHSQIHFHQLIKTEQFQLSLGNDKDQGFYGFLDLDQLNAVTEDSRISRLFTLCTSFPPGQWVSMCFAVKLSKHAQQLTVFQDGHHCFNKTFADSDLEWIYLKRSMAVREV